MQRKLDIFTISKYYYFMEKLDQLEKQLNSLKTQYNLYHIGVNKFPPLEEYDQLQNYINQLKNKPSKNTAFKFKLNSILMRFNSMDQLWRRLNNQIERGNSKLDNYRLQKHQKIASISASEPETNSENGTEPSPVSPPGPPPLSKPSSLSYLKKLKTTYQDYIKAKIANREKVEKVTFGDLAKKIGNQLPKIYQQYNCQEVEFKVGKRQGKVIFQIVPKKNGS